MEWENCQVLASRIFQEAKQNVEARRGIPFSDGLDVGAGSASSPSCFDGFLVLLCGDVRSLLPDDHSSHFPVLRRCSQSLRCVDGSFIIFLERVSKNKIKFGIHMMKPTWRYQIYMRPRWTRFRKPHTGSARVKKPFWVQLYNLRGQENLLQLGNIPAISL